MRYRVAFEKRLQSDGHESPIDPTALLDEELADGVVAEKVFVERLEPDAQHSQETLDEDDAFLALAGTEVWEYEVINDRRREFEDAIRNSKVVFEFTVVDESDTTPAEAGSVRLATGSQFVPQEAPAADTGRPTGSGVRATNYDGPAGQPTGDPSAGTPVSRGPLAREGVEGIGEAGNGALDELAVKDAGDPELGLTDATEPGDDWAADTGPSRNDVHGVQTRDLTDKSSELKPAEEGDAQNALSKKKARSSPSPTSPRRRRKTG